MSIGKSTAFLIMSVLFAFQALALDPERIRVALVIDKNKKFLAGLVDDTISNKPLFMTHINNLPQLNWAIASALSLKTTLRIVEDHGLTWVGVGEHGSYKEFLINAHQIVQVKGEDGYLEFWFDNGERRLKLFTQNKSSEVDFEQFLSVAQLFGGFITIANRGFGVAKWRPDNPSKVAFDANAWEVSVLAEVSVGFVLYSELGLLGEGEESGLKGRSLISFALAKAPPERPLLLSPAQTKFIKEVLVPTRRARGGEIACIKGRCPSERAAETCILFQPGILPGTFEEPQVVEIPDSGGLLKFLTSFIH